MKRKIHLLFIFILLFVNITANAQFTQAVKGNVMDKETHELLVGAILIMTDDSTLQTACNTDLDGNFIFKNINVGKHNFSCKMIGYATITLQNILVTSGKQVVLNFELETSLHQLKEIKIKADKPFVINEMAAVSARTFDVQETERYAGSRQDPARMASNFAGVSGTDDSRNDIVVRGNSPLGVLWRMDDIAIFNPNHFNIPGSTGGPVSIINNKTLANSDFFTSAFPAEYGNSTSSVFDLKLKNGNKDKYEGTAQFGVMGAELAAEGPISKKHQSSFVIAYRYATLDWLNALHIPIGTNSIPKYQDATIKLNFPISKKGTITLFGIGGKSDIDLIVSKYTSAPTETYGENDRDQFFKSNMGVAGISYQHKISSTAFTKIIVSKQYQMVDAHHTRIYRNADYKIDSTKAILGYNFATGKNALAWFLNKKMGAQHTLKAGINVDEYLIQLKDSIREFTTNWQNRWNYDGSAFLIQPYVQYKFRITDSLILTAGIHSQIFTLNNYSKSFEPRLGIKKILKHNQTLSFGTGLHSQLQPMYTYFYHYPTSSANQMHNINMGFTKSFHLVLGYDKVLNKNLRFKSEIYYQYLFNVPIETKAGSSFSLLNMGSGFERFFPDTLKNKGTGKNYGIEFTLEKFFSKGFYYMITGSLYNSKATGNDGIERNTDFNGNFVINGLCGYEKGISKKSTFTTGAKITYGGGKRFSDYDLAKSKVFGDGVIVQSSRNTHQTKEYFRADLKLGIRINSKKLAHEVAIDLVNILRNKNILSIEYNADKNSTFKKYQLGFLPLFYYKVDF
ncbi:MAG: hypothetical protein RIQ33_1778 [Bacteroidota bacterium]